MQMIAFGTGSVSLAEWFNTDCGLALNYVLGAVMILVCSVQLLAQGYMKLWLPMAFLGSGGVNVIYTIVMHDFVTTRSLMTNQNANDQLVLSMHGAVWFLAGFVALFVSFLPYKLHGDRLGALSLVLSACGVLILLNALVVLKQAGWFGTKGDMPWLTVLIIVIVALAFLIASLVSLCGWMKLRAKSNSANDLD